MDRGYDYIIVFGAAVRPDGQPSAVLRHRLEAAITWAKSRPQARFLVTGGLGDHPPSEAEAMRRYLLDRGIEESAIVIEPQGDEFAGMVRYDFELVEPIRTDAAKR